MLYLASVCMVVLVAHVPLLGVLRRSLLVLPIVGFFAFVVYVTGDALRAWFILSKSYLSALTVMVLIACTPMPKVAAAARFFRAPALLVEVVQLIYRYLFVLRAEARAMQIAFSARGGRSGKVGMRAASGMVSVLFARSYAKASMVYHAMQSRGFSGQLASPALPRITAAEIAITILGISLAAALHLV